MAGQPEQSYVASALDLFKGYGDQEAVVYGDRRVSYSEITATTLGLVAALADRGVRPGSAVAILVPDVPETPALQLALHMLGCRTAWIATYAPRRDQASFIRLTKPEVLIYHPAMLAAPELAAESAENGEPLRMLPFGMAGDSGDLLFGVTSRVPELPVETGGAEPESLFYSGGTTGTPKLVSHGQFFYQVLLAIAAYYLAAGEPPMRFLNGSSFAHVSGQMAGFLTLFEGGTYFLGSNSSPEDFLTTVEREQISSAFLTPALLYEVIDHPLATRADTSSLRYLNVGGAAATPARLAEAIDRFGPVVRLVYGSSEAPLIADLPFLDHDPEHPERLRSCGKPFADTRIEIRDEQGQPKPAGEAGEVWVTGSLKMAGYWGQPEQTKQAMADGWVRTGDIGYLDGDGYLYLVDRASDMIITGESAANVYCRPIEDALQSHPQVKAAAVVGIPDETYGELVGAFVVPLPGTAVSADDLRGHVRAQLNELYTPRQIRFVDELPLTAMAKVDKRKLRELAGQPAKPGPAHWR